MTYTIELLHNVFEYSPWELFERCCCTSNFRFMSRPHAFHAVVQQIIASHSDKRGEVVNIGNIAAEVNVEKRRIYDLFNFLASLNICKRMSPQSYLWIGMEEMGKKLKALFIECETRYQNGEEMDVRFEENSSPTIEELTIRLLIVFMYYLGTPLNLRVVASLLAPNQEKERPMLRRLYLVTYFMEQVGLATHHSNVGSYTAIFCTDEFLVDAMNCMLAQKTLRVTCLLSLMSRIDSRTVECIRQRRKAQLVSSVLTPTDVSGQKNGVTPGTQSRIDYTGNPMRM